MSERQKNWPNGLPSEGRSPKSGHRMAAERMQFPRRWYGGMTSANLEVIWAMSALWSRFIEAERLDFHTQLIFRNSIRVGLSDGTIQ